MLTRGDLCSDNHSFVNREPTMVNQCPIDGMVHAPLRQVFWVERQLLGKCKTTRA